MAVPVLALLAAAVRAAETARADLAIGGRGSRPGVAAEEEGAIWPGESLGDFFRGGRLKKSLATWVQPGQDPRLGPFRGGARRKGRDEDAGAKVDVDVDVDVDADGLRDDAAIDTRVLQTTGLELMTTYEGANGSYGTMFDVTASSSGSILINSFDLHAKVTGPCPVRIFTRPGSHVGYERSNEGWSSLMDSYVQCTGLMKRTQIDPHLLVSPVSIAAGETRAFYVAMESESLRYSSGINLGAVYTSNSHLMIHEGTGLGGFFGEPLFRPRVWNGVVHYTLGTAGKTGDLVSCGSSGSGSATNTGSKATVAPPVQTLTTDLDDNLAGSGAMFNVRALPSLSEPLGVMVRGMDILTDLTVPFEYEVYTKANKFWQNDAMKTIDAWSLLASGTVTGQGLGQLTPIPANQWDAAAADLVPLSAGMARAFFVTIHSDHSALRYRNATEGEAALGLDVGDVHAFDEALALEAGVGVGGYPLTEDTNFFGPRMWLGAIRYDVSGEGVGGEGDYRPADPCVGWMITETPTAGPTLVPTPAPTPAPITPAPTFEPWECSSRSALGKLLLLCSLRRANIYKSLMFPLS